MVEMFLIEGRRYRVVKREAPQGPRWWAEVDMEGVWVSALSSPYRSAEAAREALLRAIERLGRSP